MKTTLQMWNAERITYWDGSAVAVVTLLERETFREYLKIVCIFLSGLKQDVAKLKYNENRKYDNNNNSTVNEHET